MKNLFKFSGIIAIGMVIAFSGCGGSNANWSDWMSVACDQTSTFNNNTDNKVEVECKQGEPAKFTLGAGEQGKEVKSGESNIEFRFKPGTIDYDINFVSRVVSFGMAK